MKGSKFSSDVGDLGSTGWNTSSTGIGKAKAVRIGGSRLQRQKTIDANKSSNTGTVTVSGKGVKFSARSSAKVALV